MATVRDRSNDAPLDKPLDSNSFDIIPSDTVNLIVPVDAIKVTGAGNIALLMPFGNIVVMTVLAGDTQYTNQAVRVMATGTTATGLIGISSRALR